MPMLMPPSLLNSCRHELALMLDLLVACIIVQTFTKSTLRAEW
jgi:hypothetical protein